jgi:hypothetical protein
VVGIGVPGLLLMEIEVLAIGTEVTIDGEIPATIRGICIRSESNITYECVWWDERSRKIEWLTVDEIKPKSEHKAITIRPRGLA